MIREATLSDLSKLTTLHLAELPQTMNSKIGEWFIKHLYSVLLSNEDCSQVWLIEENDSTIGIISTTTNKKQITKKIFKSLKFIKWLKIFIFLLSHPFQALKTIAFTFLAKEGNSNKLLYILTLAVSKHHQRNQLGSKLLSHIESYAKENSLQFIQVDTEKSNFQANRFYKKNKYTEIKAIAGNVIFKKKL